MEINEAKVCGSCFKVIKDEPCPYCGYSKKEYRTTISELPVGTVLKERYNIGMVLGKGGFGVTYMAYDNMEKCLVAVKEYYPNGMVHRNTGDKGVTLSNTTMSDDFKTGAEKFFDEAKTVSRFNGNPNIVGVKDFFYDNGTVYYAMEYLEGMDLKHYIKKSGGKLPQENVLMIANTITDALLITHSMNVIHRDISPDNIYVKKNGEVKLIDFGAARQVMSSQSHSLSVILKQGFAPIEQYQRKGKQGPWTDIYALGATMYYALTGKIPEDATERLDEPELGSCEEYGIDSGLWKIVEKAMEVKKEGRYQSIIEMKADLNALSMGAKSLAPIEEKIENPLFGASKEADKDATVAMYAGHSQKGYAMAGETVMFDQPIPAKGGKEKPSFGTFLKKHMKAVIAAAAFLLVLVVVIVAVNSSKNSDGDTEQTNNEVVENTGDDTDDDSGEEGEDSEDGEDGEETKESASPSAEPEPEDDKIESYTDEAFYSSNIFIGPQREVMFGYKNKLYRAALDEDGILTGIVCIQPPELSSIKIYEIISDGSYIYLGTNKGIYCMPCGEQEGGEWIIEDKFISNTLYLYDGMLYFLNNKKISAVKNDGSGEFTIADNVKSYTVTEEGIYFIDESGNFVRANPDGGMQTTLEKIGVKAVVVADGHMVFAGEDEKVFFYDIGRQDLRGMGAPLSDVNFDGDNVFAWNNYLYYYVSDESTSYRYNLETGAKAVKVSGYIPSIGYRRVFEGRLYKNIGDSIKIIDLENNTELAEIDLTSYAREDGSDTKRDESSKPERSPDPSPTPGRTKTNKEKKGEDSEYILPESNSRYLSKSDLQGLTAEECRIARNELYARHGRLFNDVSIQTYFNMKSWYRGRIQPNDFDESVFNKYEAANKNLIVRYERERGYN